MLNEVEEVIKGEIDSRVEGQDSAAGLVMERESLGVDLGLKGDNGKGKLKQTVRINKKKGHVVDGPSSALRSLKPNVGKLGMGQNKVQYSNKFSSKEANLYVGKSGMGFEKVALSSKLKNGSHAAVCFQEKDKVSQIANKENDIFLFGNSSLK